MNIIKLAFKSIIVVALVFVFSMTSSLQIYGQELITMITTTTTTTTTTNSITDQIKTAVEQIKNIALAEVANNSTGKTNQTETTNILSQLGQAANKTALGGADVISNLSGEIKEGLSRK
jgi:hypothetical protein